MIAVGARDIVLCRLNRRSPYAATLIKALADPARSNRHHVAMCRTGAGSVHRYSETDEATPDPAPGMVLL